MTRGNPSKAVAAALALFAAALPATARGEALQTATSRAQVLEEIQFAVLLDMNFGKIATNGTGGVVDLNPASGSRTCAAGLVCVGGFGMSQLQLSGSEADVQVNFDPTFLLTGPGQDIVAEPQFPGGPGAVVHLSGGTATVNFGAKLYINPGQLPGTYSGDFSVNLEYN